MPTAAHVLLETDILEDCRHSQLRDSRRDERLAAIMAAYQAQPTASNPEVMPAAREQLAFYRFANNEHFDWKDVLHHHAHATTLRANTFQRVMVIHDTTFCSWRLWDQEVSRTHLSHPTSHTQGMSLHIAMACVHDHGLGYRAAPMGFLHIQPFIQRKNLKKAAKNREQFEQDKAFWQDQGGFYENESDRWFEGVAATSQRLDSSTQVVHIADREADVYGLFHMIEQLGDEYIIRVAKGDKRRVLLEDRKRENYIHVREVLDEVELSPRTHKVTIGKRPQYNARRSNYKSRTEREAKVSVKWETVALRRPNRDLAGTTPDFLECTVIELQERNPPQGAEAVRWMLFTNLSVESEQDAWDVVQSYRSRWLIEEGIDAWKNLCGVKKLQAQHAFSLLKGMVLRLPLAFELLQMRYLSNHAPDTDSKSFFSTLELLILRDKAPGGLSEKATIADAFAALGRWGGHQPRHGPVGWKILARAKLKLTAHLKGAHAVLDHLGLDACDL